MKKIIFLTLVLLLSNCTLDKVVQHHGVHNLEKKQLKLKVNDTNKNDSLCRKNTHHYTMKLYRKKRKKDLQ